jgi:hypothetical protein
MGELSPIDLDGMTVKDGLKAAVRGIFQTHECLELHIRDQQQANEDASRKREALAGDVQLLSTDVRRLAIALGVQKPAEGEERPKAKNTIPKWAQAFIIVGGIGGSIAGLGALFRFLYAIWPSVEAYLLNVTK